MIFICHSHTEGVR